MKLHKVLVSLIEAQNNHDSKAYVDCFSETAIVHDEGKTHSGKAQIQKWIEHSNREYQSVMKPLSFEQAATGNVLAAEVTGTFPGSPAVLKFHVALEGDLIHSLKITG